MVLGTREEGIMDGGHVGLDVTITEPKRPRAASVDGPTAAQRLLALRQRVVSRAAHGHLPGGVVVQPVSGAADHAEHPPPAHDANGADEARRSAAAEGASGTTESVGPGANGVQRRRLQSATGSPAGEEEAELQMKPTGSSSPPGQVAPRCLAAEGEPAASLGGRSTSCTD